MLVMRGLLITVQAQGQKKKIPTKVWVQPSLPVAKGLPKKAQQQEPLWKASASKGVSPCLVPQPQPVLPQPVVTQVFTWKTVGSKLMTVLELARGTPRKALEDKQLHTQMQVMRGLLITMQAVLVKPSLPVTKGLPEKTLLQVPLKAPSCKRVSLCLVLQP